MPAPRAPLAVQGIGPDSAQSSLIVGLSHWKWSQVAQQPGRQVLGADRAVRTGTAPPRRRAPRRRPRSARRRRAGRRARGRRDLDAARTGAAVRTRAAARRAAGRATPSVSRPEPPTGTGNPTVWPSMPAASRRSRCRPPRAAGRCAARCRRAAAAPPSPRNSSSPARRTGCTAKRAKRSRSAVPSARSQRDAGSHRRERREQRVEQRLARSLELVGQLAPGRAVAGARTAPATPR